MECDPAGNTISLDGHDFGFRGRAIHEIDLPLVGALALGAAAHERDRQLVDLLAELLDLLRAAGTN